MVKDGIKLLIISLLCAFTSMPLCVFGEALHLERTMEFDYQVTNDIGTTGYLIIESLSTDTINEPELKSRLSIFLEEHIEDCKDSNSKHFGEDYLFYDSNSIKVPYIGTKCISIIDKTINYSTDAATVNHFCFNWDREKNAQISLNDVFVSSDELVNAILTEGSKMYGAEEEISDEETEPLYQIFFANIVDHLIYDDDLEIFWYFTPEGVTIGAGYIEDVFYFPTLILLPYDRYSSIYNKEYIITQDEYILEVDSSFLVDVDHDDVKEAIKIGFTRGFESGDPYVCEIEKEDDNEYEYLLRGISYYPIDGHLYSRIYLVNSEGEQFVFVVVRNSYGGAFELNVIKFNENGIPIYIGKDSYNFGAVVDNKDNSITDIINTDPQNVICSIQDTSDETEIVECYVNAEGFMQSK